MKKIKIFFVRFLFLKFLASNSLLLTGKFVFIYIYMYTQLSFFFSKKNSTVSYIYIFLVVGVHGRYLGNKRVSLYE